MDQLLATADHTTPVPVVEEDTCLLRLDSILTTSLTDPWIVAWTEAWTVAWTEEVLTPGRGPHPEDSHLEEQEQVEADPDIIL